MTSSAPGPSPAPGPPPTVLVLDAEPLPRLGRLTGRARIEHADESTLAERLPHADVLLVWDFTSYAVRDAWPGGGPRPRWVHTASAGVDHLMCPELTESDTVVTNARGIFDQPIGEYVAALVLEMPVEQDQCRQFHPISQEVQRRLGVLFRIQDDIEIGAQQRLAEQFPLAGTIVDQQ